MKRIILISIAFFLFSCPNEHEKNVDSGRRKYFIHFLKKFTPIKLPVEISVSFNNEFSISNEFDFMSQSIDCSSNDSLFIKCNGPVWSSGYLPDTSKFYALIYGISGDERIYRIATFDKEYNKIQDVLILNDEGCSPAARCLKCNTTIKFGTDNTIQCIDTLYHLECDSTGETNDKIQNMEILMKRISVNARGEIIINRSSGI